MSPLEIGLLFVALIAIGLGIWLNEKSIRDESNSASEFTKSRHRVFNARKQKPIWKEDEEEKDG